MRKKLRRMGAGILALVMLVCMMPETALAADIASEQIMIDPQTVDLEEQEVTVSNNETISENTSISDNETDPEAEETSISQNDFAEEIETVSDNEVLPIETNTTTTEDTVRVTVASWEEMQQAIADTVSGNELDGKTILELCLTQDLDAPGEDSTDIDFAVEGKKLRITSDTESLAAGQTAFTINADISSVSDNSAVVTLTAGTNAEIELADIVLDGGAIWRDESALMNNKGIYGNGGIVETAGEGTVTLGTGCIIENADVRSTYKGGALKVTAGTTVLAGAVIQNVHSNAGGNIYVQDASLVMQSGEITNNRGQYGAAIWLYDSDTSNTVKSQFSMTGGSITNNYAWSKGGAIVLDCGNATLTGGIIENNTAGGFSSNADRTGAGNPAATGMEEACGGAVYIGCPDRIETDGDYAILTIDGATISGNKALGNTALGGGIACMEAYGDVVMRSGAVTENKTECLKSCDRISGGGIYMYQGGLKLYGGSVTYNESANNGGGISLGDGDDGAVNAYANGDRAPVALIYAGDISYNRTAAEAARSGGGIYRSEGTLAIYGKLPDGSITAGTSITHNDSNGIQLEGIGTVEIGNADISHNGDTDGSDGEENYEKNSGIYIVPVAKTYETVLLTIKDSNLSDNDASGVRIAGTQQTVQVLTLDSCTVSRNGDAGVAASQLALTNCEMCENQNSAVVSLHDDSIDGLRANLTITGGKYNDNYGEYAGAVYAHYTNVLIQGTQEAPVEFKGNSSEGNTSSRITAGAISGDGTKTLKYCVFENNQSLINGSGALYISNGNAVIENTSFLHNTGNGGMLGTGGAVTFGAGLHEVNHCTFEGNRQLNGQGGAMKLMGGTTSITNTTMTNNNADLDGGAIYGRWAELSLSNVVITGNHAGKGGAGIHSTMAFEMRPDKDKIRIRDKVVITDNIVDTTGQEINIFIDRFGGYRETDCYTDAVATEEKLAFAPVIVEGALSEDSVLGIAIDREDAYPSHSDDYWDSNSKYYRDFALVYGTEEYTVTEEDCAKFQSDLPEYCFMYDGENQTAWYQRFAKNYLEIDGERVLFDDVLTKASGDGWAYDLDTNTLSLNNFTGASIRAGMDTLHLYLKGNNTIGTLLTEEEVKKQWQTIWACSRSNRYLYHVPFYVQRILQDGDTFTYTDATNGNLVIDGDGTLHVYGTEFASVIDGQLTQNGGTFSSTSYNRGIIANNGIEVNDAILEGIVKAIDFTTIGENSHTSNYISVYGRGIHTYRMLKTSNATVRGIVEDRKVYHATTMPSMGVYVDKHMNGSSETILLCGGDLTAQAGSCVQLNPKYNNDTKKYETEEITRLSFGFGTRSDVENYGTTVASRGATSAFILGTGAEIVHKANTYDETSDLVWILKTGADAESAQKISGKFATVSIAGVSGYPTKEDFAYIAGEDVKYVEAGYEHSLILRGIKVSPTRIILKEGETASLHISYLPVDTEDREVVYTSKNPSSVVIKEGNIIKAMKKGTAIVRVASKGNSRIFAECVVNVVAVAKDFKLNITKTEGVVGEDMELMLTPVPAEDDTSEAIVSWESSDEGVATVEGDGMKAVVHPLAPGSVVLTATVTNEAGTYTRTYTCHASFKKVLTEEEIGDLAAALDPIHILTNKSDSLGDIILTENGVKTTNWTFKQDATGNDVKVTAYDNKPIQQFAAIYESEDTYPIETVLDVSVTKITSISIAVDGNGILEKTNSNTETENASVILNTVGAPIEASDWLDVNWSVTNNRIFVPQSAAFTVPITPKEKGISTLKAKVVVKDRTVVKKNVTEFETAKAFEVVDKALITEIILEPKAANLVNHAVPYTEEAEKVVVDAKDITSASNQLEITVKGNGNELARTDYTVKSSDTKVATVSAQNGKLCVTMKSAGVSILTVTARDKGKVQKQIVLNCKDYSPYIPSTNLTLNRYNETPLVFGLSEANGNEVLSVEIYEKSGKEYEATPSANFEVVEYEDVYAIGLADNSALRSITKDTKTDCKLIMTTQRGVYEQPVKITVSVKKPTVKLQQTQKANVFYRGAEAIYVLNSEAQIESVTFVANGDSKGAVFYGSYNRLTRKLMLTTYNGVRYTLSKDNLEALMQRKAAGRTGTLTVHYKGYSKEADTVMELEIGIEDKPISIVTTPVSSAVYRNSGILVSDITFIQKETQEKVAVTNVTTNTAGVSVLGGDVYSRTLKFYGKSQSVKAVLSLENDNDSAEGWTHKVNISHCIKNVAAPEIALQEKKVMLNTAVTGKTILDVSVKNDVDKIARITFADPEKAKVKAMEEGYIIAQFNMTGQTISLQVNPKAPAGRYEILLDAKIYEGGHYVDCKQLKLPVIISSKTPTVKLSAKGKIDVLDRSNTSILYIPKLSEVSGTVKKVSLKGAYASKFHAVVVDDTISLTAKNDVEFSTQDIYKIAVVLTLENGCELTSPIMNVKVTQSKPALTTSASKVTMYRKVPDYSRGYIVKPKVKNFVIEDIILTNYTDDFTFDAGTNMLTLKEGTTLKAGTYKLKFKVCFRGEAMNTKDITTTLNVVVK